MGSQSSALTGISRDDGGILKQVKLTGQELGPRCLAPLQGNLTEGVDGGTVRLLGRLLEAHYM